MKVYQEIATRFNAIQNCIEANNSKWEQRHGEAIDALVEKYLPSGSGFDNGTTFNYDESKDNRLVFDSAYHRMDEHGYYDGWIEFKVIISPSLQFGLTLNIVGKFGKHQDLKSYIDDTFYNALDQEVE